MIYVAPKTSAAFTAAQGKANETMVFAESSLQKALDKVGPLLNTSGAHKADILLAGSISRRIIQRLKRPLFRGRFSVYETGNLKTALPQLLVSTH